MRTAFFLPVYTVPVLILLSCSDDKRGAVKPPTPATPNSTVVATAAKAPDSLYHSYYLSGASALVALAHEIGEPKMKIVFDLNRRDLQHLKVGDTIEVPNADDSILTYSPFPKYLASLDSVEKLLFVSRRVQAFGAYRFGKLVMWGPTSTGKKSTPTPAQLYHTNWKSLETHSTVDAAWVLKWYFNLDNLEGVSLHEFALPGYPASHSCVRLLADDAEWLYHWADQWKLTPDGRRVAKPGTPVIVFGDYAYGKIAPWKKLRFDPHATDITIGALDSAVVHYYPATSRWSPPSDSTHGNGLAAGDSTVGSAVAAAPKR